MEVFLLCTVFVILGAMAIAITVVICNNRYVSIPDQEDRDSVQYGWSLELWDSANRRPIRGAFTEWTVLGRGIPGYTAYGEMAIGDNVTLSRQQCVISTSYGYPLIWNLAKVNPTLVNGQRVDAPTPLREGDTLTCGTCHYVVTRLQYALLTR